MNIKGYELNGELKTTNSGFSKWGYARKNGTTYFIKEFIDPVYHVHTELLDPALVRRKQEICEKYSRRSSELYREINACSDGNLVYIEEFFRHGSHYYLTMEKVTAVSRRIGEKTSQEDRIRICKSLLHSVGKLHQKGIVHADIKLDNIMFRELASGKIAGKIIDFDNSFWESDPPSPESEVCGDPVYMAPETYMMMAEEEGRLTSAIDVFALGLVFHQILSGDLPKFDRSRYQYPFEAVLNGESLICSSRIPEVWKKMIEAMTEKDCKKRITLEEAEKIWKKQMNPVKKTTGFFTPAGDL